MKYQTIKENGKVKFVVLPVEVFESLLDRLQDESDLKDIREANSELLYAQSEAEDYIFMNPVKRERLEKGYTQQELADRTGSSSPQWPNGNEKGLSIAKQPGKNSPKPLASAKQFFPESKPSEVD